MKQADTARARPQNPTAAEPSHLRWDTSGMQSHQCALATASATSAEIILNLGAKRGRDSQGGEVKLELLRRISLSPLTAKNLMATLERVIVDHDRTPRRAR